MKEKEKIRYQIWQLLLEKNISKAPFHRIPPFKGQGKAAERLRHLLIYQKSKTIMVPPDEAQKEVRFNALMDGKTLIMATPGLSDGFYILKPKDIPRKFRYKAIQTYGVKQYGKRLPTRKNAIGHIDLLITGAVAVSIDGKRLGKGAGFFDIEYAILRELGCIDENTPVIAIVHDEQILNTLPKNMADVPIDYIITPSQVIKVKMPLDKPKRIFWEKLSQKQIHRMRPLWELSKRK